MSGSPKVPSEAHSLTMWKLKGRNHKIELGRTLEKTLKTTGLWTTNLVDDTKKKPLEDRLTVKEKTGRTARQKKIKFWYGERKVEDRVIFWGLRTGKA